MRLGLQKSLLTIMIVIGFGELKSQEFKTIKIGKQEWMASNFSLKVPGSWAYNEDPAMEAKYGRLYTWDAAVKACPKGWRLPTLQDWDELVTFLGGEDKAGEFLKVNGNSGFNAKFAGMTGVGNFRLVESFGAFWTATPFDNTNCWYVYLSKTSQAATLTYTVKTQGFSVRYIKSK